MRRIGCDVFVCAPLFCLRHMFSKPILRKMRSHASGLGLSEFSETLNFIILELQTACAKESHCRIKWVLKSTTTLIELMLMIRKILLLGSGFVAKPTLD